MTDIKIPVTARVRELVEGGVITIGAHITSDGIETYARCTQPHPRLGITTHESMTLADAEERLAKVSTPASKFKGKVAEREDTPLPLNASLHGFSSVADAALKGKRLRKVGYFKAGSKNFLPEDSLHPHDFTRSASDLYACACAIAEKLGTAKLTSRISSKPEVYRINSATSLREWWYASTPQQRFALLTRKQVYPHRKEGGVLVNGKWLDRLQELQCPFQDAEAQVGPPQGVASAEEELHELSLSSDDEQDREVSIVY
jgi:hypothetical protein